MKTLAHLAFADSRDDDFAVFVDQQCTLHIGACCNDRIMNTHSPKNLQRCPADINFIAACY